MPGTRPCGSGFVDGFSAKVDPLGVGIGNELRELGPVEHAFGFGDAVCAGRVARPLMAMNAYPFS